MLFACDTFPHLARHCAASVCSAVLPPVLAQARVGLEWLLKMHPAPQRILFSGGRRDRSRHLATAGTGLRCLQLNWKPRPVHFGVGANLAGRCAAAFAMASRLYAPYDQPVRAPLLRGRAERLSPGPGQPVVADDPARRFLSGKDLGRRHGAGGRWNCSARPKSAITCSRRSRSRTGRAQPAKPPASTTPMPWPTTLCTGLSGRKTAPTAGVSACRTPDYARLRAENPYGLATPYIWGTAEAAAGAAINCLLYARLLEDEERQLYTIWPADSGISFLAATRSISLI